MAWIEFHAGLWNHWKIQRLASKLQIPYAHALGMVSCLWTWTVTNSREGDLSRFTDPEVAAAMRSETPINGIKETLQQCELVDQDGHLHDWKNHGTRLLDQAKQRMEKYRSKDSKEDSSESYSQGVDKTSPFQGERGGKAFVSKRVSKRVSKKEERGCNVAEKRNGGVIGSRIMGPDGKNTVPTPISEIIRQIGFAVAPPSEFEKT